jgi:ATP-binding cassette subfamily F protein 3
LSYTGTVVIVSHDRFFLDRLVHRVIEIRDGQCQEYHGNYSYFIQKRSETVLANDANGSGAQTECRPQCGGQDVLAATKSYKTKEEKRLEAEERNRLARITRTLKNELSVVEDRIAHLEEKRGENEQTLCEPGIHREPQKIKRLNQEMLDVARELETLYSDWDDLTEKLETRQPVGGVTRIIDS